MGSLARIFEVGAFPFGDGGDLRWRPLLSLHGAGARVRDASRNDRLTRPWRETVLRCRDAAATTSATRCADARVEARLCSHRRGQICSANADLDLVAAVGVDHQHAVRGDCAAPRE